MFSDSWPVGVLLYAGAFMLGVGLAELDARLEARRRERRRRRPAAPPAPAPRRQYSGGPFDGVDVCSFDPVQAVFKNGAHYIAVRQGRDFANAFRRVELGEWTYPGLYACDGDPSAPGARWEWKPMRSQFAQFGRRAWALAIPVGAAGALGRWLVCAIGAAAALWSAERAARWIALRLGDRKRRGVLARIAVRQRRWNWIESEAAAAYAWGVRWCVNAPDGLGDPFRLVDAGRRWAFRTLADPSHFINRDGSGELDAAAAILQAIDAGAIDAGCARLAFVREGNARAYVDTFRVRYRAKARQGFRMPGDRGGDA